MKGEHATAIQILGKRESQASAPKYKGTEIQRVTKIQRVRKTLIIIKE